MLNVLFLSHGNAPTNTINFVPALLGSVLEAQPKLGWEKMGDLTYQDITFDKKKKPKLGGFDVTGVDLVCHTVYHQTILHPYWYRNIARTHDEIHATNKNTLAVVGGPASEDLAAAVLIRTKADFFIAGSALWSFRKLCEHVKECKETGKPLDREYIRTLPGVYQRTGPNDEDIIPPYSSVHQTRFIKDLVIYPDPVFQHNLAKRKAIKKPEKKKVKRIIVPYPMFNRCTGGCSFCDYDQIGVPLSRGQKQEYVKRAEDLAGQHNLQAYSHWLGPNFDFGDELYHMLMTDKNALRAN